MQNWSTQNLRKMLPDDLLPQFREHRGQKDLGRRFKHHKDLNLEVKPVHEQAK